MTTTQQFTERKVKVNGVSIHLVDWGNHHLSYRVVPQLGALDLTHHLRGKTSIANHRVLLFL